MGRSCVVIDNCSIDETGEEGKEAYWDEGEEVVDPSDNMENETGDETKEIQLEEGAAMETTLADMSEKMEKEDGENITVILSITLPVSFVFVVSICIFLVYKFNRGSRNTPTSIANENFVELAEISSISGNRFIENGNITIPIEGENFGEKSNGKGNVKQGRGTKGSGRGQMYNMRERVWVDYPD